MTAAVGTERYVAFQDQLVDAGVLVRSTVKGLYGKARAFVEVFDGLDRMVTLAGSKDGAELYRFPPMLPRDHFVQTDYLRSFPDLIGSIHSFCGGDAEHADFLRRVDDGEDWSESLDPTELVLVPAACYPIYPMITGQLPAGGRTFDVLGSCFRHEGSDDPARMMVFHQHEYVHVGTPESAVAFRDSWLERSQEMMTGLGLDIQAEVANDPFFGRAGRMLASSQRQAALKFEVVATVADPDRPTAIVSCNCHQDHLTVPFEITSSDGERAHSACVGFGMERIVLALFSAHGTDTGAWPDEVRRRLWS
jgi:seryl-tRNA synthetase